MKVQISDIDETVWRTARMTSLSTGETMGKLVGRALGELLGIKPKRQQTSSGDDNSSGGTPEVKAVRTSHASSTLAAGPITDEEVPTKRCHKCKDKVTKWTMQPDGKPICDSCKADLESAIP